MPVLPLEPFLFPDDLFTTPLREDDTASRWWVLHTKPRAEKTLARRFRQRGASFFLPLYNRQWRNRGRLFSSYLPLFSGYLFLHGEGARALDPQESRMVAQCLSAPAQEELQADLSRLYQLIASGAPLTPEERLEPGALVEITSGPLAGLTGKVIRSAAGRRFVVQVNFLQKGASVLLDHFALQALAVPA